jgi:cell division protein FtsW (lipid II flippase)
VSLGFWAAEDSTYKPNARLVLAFFALAMVGFVAILAAAPDIYSNTVKVPHIGSHLTGTALVAGLFAFLLLLSIGTLRRWRWLFWLILVAFLAGILRLAASVLQLEGILSPTGPAWFTLLQAGIGVVQFLIGLAMIAGYRRSGAWGAF